MLETIYVQKMNSVSFKDVNKMCLKSDTFKTFWSKLLGRREHNAKDEFINDVEKEREKIEDGSAGVIFLESLSAAQ